MPTRPFQRDDVLAVGEDDARDCDLVHRADGLADHGEGIAADLAIEDDVVMAASGTTSRCRPSARIRRCRWCACSQARCDICRTLRLRHSTRYLKSLG